MRRHTQANVMASYALYAPDEPSRPPLSVHSMSARLDTTPPFEARGHPQ